jgi:uncharacterized membrane protein YhdT
VEVDEESVVLVILIGLVEIIPHELVIETPAPAVGADKYNAEASVIVVVAPRVVRENGFTVIILALPKVRPDPITVVTGSMLIALPAVPENMGNGFVIDSKFGIIVPPNTLFPLATCSAYGVVIPNVPAIGEPPIYNEAACVTVPVPFNVTCLIVAIFILAGLDVDVV